MFEPNRDYILEPIRKLWYTHDEYFDAGSEAALSHRALFEASAGVFACESLRYFGGPAFFLVYNSLIFRVPHPVKALAAPALMTVEALYNRLPMPTSSRRFSHAGAVSSDAACVSC
jgi:hypothetical protein